MGSRGKNTCEALEVTSAILLQASRRSEELRFSNVRASANLYKCSSRMTAKRKSNVKPMRDPVWGREKSVMGKGNLLNSP